MSPNKSSLLTRYGISVAAVTVAVSVTILIRFLFSLNPTPLIIAAVIAAAWYGGKYPGLLACLLVDLSIDFFFEDPPYRFNSLNVHLIRLIILSIISLLTSARKNAEDKLKEREKQQAAVARLGQKALSKIPLTELFEESSDLIKKTLDVDYSAICELIAGEDKLRYVAGSGWRENVVGYEFSYDSSTSMAGYLLSAGQPVIFEDLNSEKRFIPSRILLEHKVNKGIGVIISQHEQAFGMLGAFDRGGSRLFSRDDVNFLQAVANVLATAVERMRAEETVSEQREWLKTTLASIGDAVIATDRNGSVTFMNPVAEALTGWDEKSAGGRNLNEVFNIINEESRQKVENPVTKVIREGLIVGLANHTILISKDNKEIPIDDCAAPIKDKDGKISGVVLVFHDISERTRTEKANEFLSNAAAVLSASLDLETTLNTLAGLTVPVLADLCIIDLITEKSEIQRLAVTFADPSKGQLADVIKQCADFDLSAARGIPSVLRTGKAELYEEDADVLSTELICGSAEIKDFQGIKITSALIVPLIAHGRTVGVISLLLTENGRRFHESHLQLIDDFANRAALAVDNASLYQSVQEANRIKDEFLATLSHELRTPLNSILGWSRLLRLNEYAPEQVKKAVEIIERNAWAQKQIVEDVLDVSRIITGKLRVDVAPVDLVPVIEAAIETIRPSADAKEIKINFSASSSVPKVSGDSGRLQQVMWNLLTNAVKFTPKGGRIDINIDLVESNAEITVADTGKGISPEFLPFVFDRFRQADSSKTREFGGLGLGLAIVRYIVELHGGQVKAESAGENAGAKFFIDLPIIPILENHFDYSGLPAPAADFEEIIMENSLEKIKILVIEDDADSRAMITVLLEQYGASVTAVGSSREALKSLQTEKPDIVISDIGLPEEDGYEFMRKFKALDLYEGQNIPAIALTAYAREEDRVQALLTGYQMHIAKPVEPAELVAAIKSLLPARDFQNRIEDNLIDD